MYNIYRYFCPLKKNKVALIVIMSDLI